MSIKLDIGPENVVAICLERPIEMIVSIIDIFNLGARPESEGVLYIAPTTNWKTISRNKYETIIWIKSTYNNFF